MNTTEIIARLPKAVQDRTSAYKSRYAEIVANMDYENARNFHSEASGYCKALQDVGLVNKEEKSRLYSYLTI